MSENTKEIIAGAASMALLLFLTLLCCDMFAAGCM